MGGFHIKYRQSNNLYVGIRSTLRIPANLDGDSTKQVYPEFFHGFYYGDHGMDTGLYYKDGTFRLCSWAFLKTVPDVNKKWQEAALNKPINKGDEILLKSYVQGSSLVSEVYRAGILLGKLASPLSTAGATQFANGSYMHREMTIGANRNDYAPSKAYFSNATFTKSDVTKKGGITEILTQRNSTLKAPYSDSLPVPSTFRYGGYTCDEGAYVADVASADCR